MSHSNCFFLTCIQISQEAGNSHVFKNFPQFVVIYTIKGFGVINKAEVDIFLEFSCFFDDPEDVGNLISASSVFLNPSWTSGSSRFTYCWSLAWRTLSITLLACERVQLCSSLNVLWQWTSFGLEWKLTFSSPVATTEFSKFAGILSAALSQHHLLGSETAQWNSINSTSFVHSDAS